MEKLYFVQCNNPTTAGVTELPQLVRDRKRGSTSSSSTQAAGKPISITVLTDVTVLLVVHGYGTPPLRRAAQCQWLSTGTVTVTVV
eukprot:1794669-Rhodomonas_salina.1